MPIWIMTHEHTIFNLSTATSLCNGIKTCVIAKP